MKAAYVTIDEVPARSKRWWGRRSWADLGVRRGRPLPRGFLGVASAYCGSIMTAAVVLILFASGPLPGEVPPTGDIALGLFAGSTVVLMARQRPQHAFAAAFAGLAAAAGLALVVHHAQVPNAYGRAALYVATIAVAYCVCFGVTWIPRLGGRRDPVIREPARTVELEVLWDLPDQPPLDANSEAYNSPAHNQ